MKLPYCTGDMPHDTHT